MAQKMTKNNFTLLNLIHKKSTEEKVEEAPAPALDTYVVVSEARSIMIVDSSVIEMKTNNIIVDESEINVTKTISGAKCTSFIKVVILQLSL